MDEEEVLGFVLCWVKYLQRVVFEEFDLVVEVAHELETALSVFVVPEFAVDDGVVAEEEVFAAYQDKVFKVFDVEFNAGDWLVVEKV